MSPKWVIHVPCLSGRLSMLASGSIPLKLLLLPWVLEQAKLCAYPLKVTICYSSLAPTKVIAIGLQSQKFWSCLSGTGHLGWGAQYRVWIPLSDISSAIISSAIFGLPIRVCGSWLYCVYILLCILFWFLLYIFSCRFFLLIFRSFSLIAALYTVINLVCYGRMWTQSSSALPSLNNIFYTSFIPMDIITALVIIPHA